MRIPSVTGKELCRAAEKRGWEYRHAKGSHHHYHHEDYEYPLIIPVHSGQTIARGLLRKIMKEGGIERKDL